MRWLPRSEAVGAGQDAAGRGNRHPSTHSGLVTGSGCLTQLLSCSTDQLLTQAARDLDHRSVQRLR